MNKKALSGLLASLIALLTSACAGSFRTIGMQDPSVEIVRALATAQVETIKALTDALVRAQANACEVPR